MGRSNVIGRRGASILIMTVISVVFISFASQDVYAKPFRMGKIPDKGATFGCGTCHVHSNGGGPRNSFGRDYAKIAVPAGEKYSSELGAMDSDGDGYSNDREFDAGTHPGDLKSKPAQ